MTHSRPARLFSLVLSLAILSACDSSPRTLTLALPESPIDQAVAGSLSGVFDRQSDMQVELGSEALTDEHAIDALVSGAVDIALISNSMPYQDGVATVIPMYPTVLHVGHTRAQEAASLRELLEGADVFAGPAGSASRVMLDRVLKGTDRDGPNFRYVEEPSLEDIPDVFVVFAPISPTIIREQLKDAPPFRLVGIGPADSVGTGSPVDAAALLNPYFRPFVIPAATYGDFSPEPALTLAVDKVLLTRKDLDKAVVYDLINELVRLRPALAAEHPGLFAGLTGDFDASRSTFVLHEGSLAYLQREAPSVYERYSGVAEVVVTVIVALGSATLAGTRIYRMRRKNRIDVFYTEVIRLRSSLPREPNEEQRIAAADRIRALQDDAFDLLVDEKLAADDSFRIFLALANEVLDELGHARGPDVA